MHVSYGMGVVQGMQINWNSFNLKPLGKLLGCQHLQARNLYTSKPVFEVVCIDLKFGSNEFHERIVDGKNDSENVSKRHLGILFCKEFDLFRANMMSDPSCVCGCTLEDVIHYLLECPLYTNARMQLIMSITPYTVISIEYLLFGNKCIHEYI
jgi:hypothetical protein